MSLKLKFVYQDKTYESGLILRSPPYIIAHINIITSDLIDHILTITIQIVKIFFTNENNSS